MSNAFRRPQGDTRRPAVVLHRDPRCGQPRRHQRPRTGGDQRTGHRDRSAPDRRQRRKPEERRCPLRRRDQEQHGRDPDPRSPPVAEGRRLGRPDDLGERPRRRGGRDHESQDRRDPRLQRRDICGRRSDSGQHIRNACRRLRKRALVDCFDLTLAAGVLHIRGWSATTVSATTPPDPRDVWLNIAAADPTRPCSNSLGNGEFFTNGAVCSSALEARIALGIDDPTLFEFVAHGAECPNAGCPLTYDAVTQTWKGRFDVAPASGPTWLGPAGSVAPDNDLATRRERGRRHCTINVQNNNPCAGTFGNVQRIFGAMDERPAPSSPPAYRTTTAPRPLSAGRRIRTRSIRRSSGASLSRRRCRGTWRRRPA